MTDKPTAVESKHDPRLQNAKRLEQLDNVFKALSHPVRRHILLTLKFRGENLNAGDIASRYACKWATVARHLTVLKKAGLISVKRQGRNQIYKLNNAILKEVLEQWLSYFD